MNEDEMLKRFAFREQEHPGITGPPSQGGEQWEYRVVDATRMSFADLHQVMKGLQSKGWSLAAVLDSSGSSEAPHLPELHILVRHRINATTGDRDIVCA
jgi:hypothetical protein